MRKSERSGAGAEDIYVPSLWYFDHLNFLVDQETQLEGICTLDDSFEIEMEKEAKKKKFDPTNFLETAVNHLQKSGEKPNKDEADIYGEAWAVTFRKLSTEQQIFAKKVMDETLMYAQLGHLTLESSVDLGRQQVPKQVLKQLNPRRHHSNVHYNYSNSNSYESASSPFSQFSTISPVTPSPAPSPIYLTTPSCRTTPSNKSVQIISNEILQSQNPYQELFDDIEYQ